MAVVKHYGFRRHSVFSTEGSFGLSVKNLRGQGSLFLGGGGAGKGEFLPKFQKAREP